MAWQVRRTCLGHFRQVRKRFCLVPDVGHTKCSGLLTLIVWNLSDKIIPYPYTLISPIHTQKSEFLEEKALSTHFMKWVDLIPLFVCTHNFAFSDPPFHTQIWTSWLLHFFLKPPPGHLLTFTQFIYSIKILQYRLHLIGNRPSAPQLLHPRSQRAAHLIW